MIYLSEKRSHQNCATKTSLNVNKARATMHMMLTKC